MQVTEDPGQNGLGTAPMDTLAGTPRVPVIVMVFDVAGFPEAQASDEVRTQVTTSPDTGL